MQIKTKTSYQIDTKSDFLYNLVKAYIFKINTEVGLFIGKTLFGSYIEEADKPSSKNSYIVTRNKVDNITVLDLTGKAGIIECLCIILGADHKEFITYCKSKLKDKHIDTLYYYITVLKSKAFKDNKLDETKAKYILNEYVYRGMHTQKEKYETIFATIKDPTPERIYELFKAFNDENGGYGSLTYMTTTLIDDEKLPQYIADIYKDDLNNSVTIKNLLKFAGCMVTAKDFNEFTLKLIIAFKGY